MASEPPCVTFQNEYLVRTGAAKAEPEIRAALEELGEVRGAETVSRCDLAVDIGAKEDIGAWTEDAWITRAERVARYSKRAVCTGWSVGLGADVSGRVYDKLREILEESKKRYFFDLWRASGWFHGDPVMRVEFQFRRPALKQLNISTVAEVLAARPALWLYASEEWTRLTVPNVDDETRARWPTHPFWRRVQGVALDGTVTALARTRPNNGAPRSSSWHGCTRRLLQRPWRHMTYRTWTRPHRS